MGFETFEYAALPKLTHTLILVDRSVRMTKWGENDSLRWIGKKQWRAFSDGNFMLDCVISGRNILRRNKWMRTEHVIYNETRTSKERRVAHSWVFCSAACMDTFCLCSGSQSSKEKLVSLSLSLSPNPRPLSTAVLARTTDKLPNHHALQVQSLETSLALGISPLLS